MSVERGDIIRLRGYVAEFPTNQMTSVTQFTPVTGIANFFNTGSTLSASDSQKGFGFS